LPPGSYDATVTISSRVAPQDVTVDVTFEVIDKPQIFLSADQIDFVAVERSTTPITKMVSVAERIRRNIDFASSTVSASAWLQVSLDTNVTPAMMTLTADPTGLGPSPRGDSVDVTSAEGGADTVAVTLGISQGPAIALSPDTIRFTMARTGPLPDVQVVTIENDSSGTLTGLSVGAPSQPWLRSNPLDSTTAPTSFSLWADSSGFTPGTDTAEVVVTRSGGGDRTVTAVFTMTQGPALSLSSDFVEFYSVEGLPVPAGQSIAVSNGGDGTLDGITARSDSLWLSVTPPGPSAAPVELTLTPNTVLAPGMHAATVTVASSVASNTPTTVSVTYNVAPVGAPSLALSPDSVHFTAVQNGPLPSDRVVQIENVGGGALTGISASDTAGWLSVSLKQQGKRTSIELSADPAGYAPGVHTAQVTVTSSDPTGPRVVPAVLTVLPAPTIEFSTDLVRFRGIEGQGQRPDLAVAVTNGSNGKLPLPNDPVHPGWPQVTTLDSTAAPTGLTLGFDTDSATPPVGSSTVSVVSSVASNSPAALAVEYRVDPFVEPLANYSPHDTVRFTSVLTEAPPAERVIEIANVGGGTLTVTPPAINPEPWLTVVSEPAGNPTRLRLTADPTGLLPGTLLAQIVVAFNGSLSPDTVPVEYTILAGPQIALSVNQLTLFGVEGSAVTAPQTVLVSNSSNATLQGLSASARGNSSWLNVDDGSLPDSITVSIDTVGLATSTYNGWVDVTSSVAGVLPASIAVEFEWLATAPSGNPEISLSPPGVFFTLTETETVGPQYVSIDNAGGGILTVTSATDTAGWLGVTLDPPMNPTRLRLDADNYNPVDYPADSTYNVDIEVASNDPASPVTTIPVSFTLLAGPELALSSDSVTFYADSGQAVPVSQAVAVANGSGGTLTGVAASSSETWLTVAPPVPSAASVELTLTPNAVLAPGTHAATVTVASSVASNSPDTIDVTYVVGPPAVIGTSSDNIDFTSARYEPVPTPHVLMIENIGGGTLDGLSVQTVPDASAWLDANLDSTTAPATLSLTVTATDFAPSTQATDLIISSPVAAPDTITVSLTVLPGPQLVVSSDTVRFYSGFRQRPLPEAQVVALSNQSAGTLSGITITVSPPGATWLDTTLVSAPAEVTLRPNTSSSGLTLGTNTATVSISSPVSSTSAEIAVEYILDPGAEFALSTSAVQFVATPTDPDPAQREVLIENVGTGTLDSLDINPATLPGSGWLQTSFDSTTAPATLTLVADPAALAPGSSDTAIMEITSPNADPILLPVTLTVLPGPRISASADSVSFRAVSGQALPDPQQITVLNGAGGTLSGITTSGNGSWLGVTPPAGTAPTKLTLQPLDTDSAPGTYVDTLLVESPVASNTPAEIVVTYKLAPGPVLSASPAQVVMTGVSRTSDTDVQTVLLENVSAGTLGGLTVGNTPSWLSTSLNTTDAPAILTLTADPSALPVDTVSHMVTVSSNDAANTADIAVTFVVSEPTTLSLSPQTVVFNSIDGETSAPDAQTVSIINSGSGQLRDIAVLANQSWLTCSLSTSSGPATVTVWPNQVLESRSAPYTANIDVSSSTAVNSPRVAYVEYFVQPPAGPVIRVSPDSLAFTRDNPGAQTVNITNGGSGTLRDLVVEVAYQGGTDWLFVLLDTRVAPAKLTVAFVTQNAPSGQTTATLTISGEGAVDQQVTVTLLP